MPRPITLLLCSSLFTLSACTDSADTSSDATSESSERLAPFGLLASYMEAGQSLDSMAMVRPEGSAAIGTAKHIVERGSVDGRDVLFLMLIQELRSGTMRDSLVVDAATLLPIEYYNSMPGMQSIHTVYDAGGHVRSEIDRGGVESGVDTVLAGPHLDAGAFTSLLPAFPYEPEMNVEVPVFHYEEGALVYSVRVAGSEYVTVCGQERDAWLVDVGTTRNVTRHWVDKDSREVVKVSVDLGEGRRFEQGKVCREE